MARGRLPLGTSDFPKIRRGGLTYVDKSLLIRDVIADSAEAILLTRPRRFGKTLNLSLLRTYLEKTQEDRWPLFEGLAIAEEQELRRRHFQRYPTIALTFKDVKAPTWAECRAAMARLIAEAYAEHRYLLSTGGLAPEEHDAFESVLRQEADDAALWAALRSLSALLARHHGERVLILIDEYDTPIHGGYVSGYYDQAIGFFRNFLSGGLKDNPHLYKGVMTGVLRIAKDSVLTGLNNLDVYSLLRPEYAAAFGFSEDEVRGLLAEDAHAGQADPMDALRSWYNGYIFGGRVVYNPWSVLSYLKSADRQLRPYWVETSSNDLVRELLIEHGLGLDADLEALLRGETIERPIVEHVALREVREQGDSLWSLLLFTGYLKVVAQRWEMGTPVCTLALPNLEVATIYRDLLLSWARKGLGGDREREALLRAILAGDAESFQRRLERWIDSGVSFFDTARREPERFYHGFVLGLLVGLQPRYEVQSNRESGYGRCDVLVTPRQAGQPGAVLELKVRDPERETVEQALDRAEAQLAERQYTRGLVAAGAAPVQQWAVVFDGKRVHLRLRSGAA